MSASLFFPVAASEMAAKVDHLFFYTLGVAAFFIFAIGGAIVFLGIRYRHRPGPRTTLPSSRFVVPIELAWTIGPLLLCMVMYFWGASLYVQGATVPTSADEVTVVAKQWMWKIQHAGGQREINQLHVPLGRTIKLLMTSQDVIHSFYVPELRIKMDVLPDRYTFLWFNATRLGTFHLLCTQYCGTQHARMRGEVVVMNPADYDLWLEARTGAKTAAQLGAELFVKFGCVACHRSEEAHRAPALEGVYGSRVLLGDGSTVFADENYLHEKISDPAAKTVAGYPSIMPSYRGSLSDDELLQLVAYVKSLGQAESEPGGSGLLDGKP